MEFLEEFSNEILGGNLEWNLEAQISVQNMNN